LRKPFTGVRQSPCKRAAGVHWPWKSKPWKGPLPKPHKPQARSIGDVIHSALQRSSIHLPPGVVSPPPSSATPARNHDPFFTPQHDSNVFGLGRVHSLSHGPKCTRNTSLVWLHQRLTYPKHTCWPGTISGDRCSFLSAAMAGGARGQGLTGNEGEGGQNEEL
jgi:hypothetical protein